MPLGVNVLVTEYAKPFWFGIQSTKYRDSTMPSQVKTHASKLFAVLNVTWELERKVSSIGSTTKYLNFKRGANIEQ